MKLDDPVNAKQKFQSSLNDTSHAVTIVYVSAYIVRVCSIEVVINSYNFIGWYIICTYSRVDASGIDKCKAHSKTYYIPLITFKKSIKKTRTNFENLDNFCLQSCVCVWCIFKYNLAMTKPNTVIARLHVCVVFCGQVRH